MSPRTRIRIRSTAPLDGPTPSHRYAILPGRATAFAQQNIRHSASSAYHAHSLSAGQSLQKVSLDRLMRFGAPPLTPSKIVESAELTRNELSQRLQRRVNAHLSLPYLPASNPHIKQVMSIYRRSLDEINALPPIRTVEDNSALVEALITMVDDATDVIGMFANGFKESKRYLSEEQISSFLNRAIQSRISIRLIAEQHLSLSKPEKSSSDSRIGIVDKKIKLKKTLESVLEFCAELCEGTYGIAPEWRLLGEVDTEVCFVEMHLQYVLIEVIKNAFRATVEHHREVNKSTHPPIPPIEVTLALQRPSAAARDPKDSTHHLVSHTKASQSILCIRIRDHGGGIDRQDLPHVFSYAFSTVGAEEIRVDDRVDHGADLGRISHGQEGLKSSLGRIAGLGFG